MGSLFASQQWTDQGPPFKISFISKQWLAWGGIYMKNTENHTLWLLNNSLNSEDNEPGGNSWKAENGTKPVWVVSSKRGEFSIIPANGENVISLQNLGR